MAQNNDNQAETRFIQRKIEIIHPRDYAENPPIIRSLNEEKAKSIAEIRKLNNELENTKASLHLLELQKQELQMKLDVANHAVELPNENKALSLTESTNETKVSIHELELLILKRELELKLEETVRLHSLELQKQELQLKLDVANHAVEILNEDKALSLTRSSSLEGLVESSKANIHELELLKQKFELELKEANDQLNEASRKSFLQYLVTVVATIILGIGINIAVSAPYAWIGWVMVIFGGILEVIAFLIAFLPVQFFKKAGRRN